MNAALILNHAAGALQGDRAAVSPDDLQGAFREQGVAASLRLAAPPEIQRAVRAALAAQPDAIFVGGGDGTVSTAAGVLAGSDVPLGVLPLGTLNHFARDLGVPPGWREAVAQLARGLVRAVDVGEVNGRVFINNASIGSYAEAVRQRDALRRRHGFGKWRAMLLASFEEFRRMRRLRVRIATDSDSAVWRTPFVLIANNAYSGRVLASCLRPRLDEGRLWIYTTRARRRLTLLRIAWETLTQRIDEAAGLEKRAVNAATLTPERASALPLAVDGELTDLQPPLRFRVRAAALRVLVPPKENGAG